ncbi:hypothetical protein ABZ801_00975 [Actinomadura sp. NPDC047616]|uniref:hypothetical protein n=1 Tax=Actinomadura sp. NPDC047616 TaxID=3155914 RepID=UPI0033C0CCFE
MQAYTPLMICVRCRTPLKTFEEYDSVASLRRSATPRGDLLEVRYLHPPRPEPWDHEPEPGVANVDSEIAMICDFCSSPGPRFLWLTGGKARLLRAMDGGGQVHDFGSSPWAACNTCSAIVRAGNLHMLLDRWRKCSFSLRGANRHQRREEEALIRRMFSAFLNTRPQGPFPIPPSGMAGS